mgnify:CR=1 FL=1
MEIRSEITGLDGNRIVITASDPSEFISAINMLTKPKITSMVEGVIPRNIPVKQKPKRTYTKTNINEKQIQTMIGLKRDGMPVKEIAKTLGIKYKTVWNKTRKIKPRPIKTQIEKLETLRKSHTKNIPVYHTSCPACQPWCGSTLDDWLARSKQARIYRLVEFRRNNKNPQG